MKYKKGDRVRIVSETKEEMNWTSEMDIYLGKVMTIDHTVKSAFSKYYKMVEDDGGYCWDDSMIVGLASETPFDFGAWKDKNVSMHCRTREEAEDFCNEMHKAGLTWSSGTSYLKMSCFNIYENYTCYRFNEGEYDNTVHAKNKGYTILEWSDYRSTEPQKEEQEKTMETQIDDKPLSYQEAMDIYKRLCEYHCKRNLCRECPISSFKNYTRKRCQDFTIEDPGVAEPILKKWLAEHPVKTNRDKFVEFFGEIQKYDDECEHHCATVPCTSCNWWHQEYVEPEK